MPTEPKVGREVPGEARDPLDSSPGLGSLPLPGAQLSSSVRGHWTCLPASWSLPAGLENHGCGQYVRLSGGLWLRLPCIISPSFPPLENLWVESSSLGQHA